MQVEVNGTRLWFDVDGRRSCPTAHDARAADIVLVHGGPGQLRPLVLQAALPLAD